MPNYRTLPAFSTFNEETFKDRSHVSSIFVPFFSISHIRELYEHFIHMYHREVTQSDVRLFNKENKL